MPIDLDAVTAIDTHVHVEDDGHGHHSLDDELMAASAAYFKAGVNRTPGLADIAAYYRERGLAAVVFTVDAQTATGHPPVSSAQLIADARAYDDVVIPFASVDPLAPDAADRLRELAAAGARGLKLHPSLQAFVPSDRAHYPLYEAAAELGLPVVFHTGQTGIGAGPARRARHQAALLRPDADRRRRRRPPGPDDHPGPPVGAVAGRCHLDGHATRPTCSSTCPAGRRRYFPPQLVRAAGSLLRHKVLFGSDFPVITPDRWLADFAELDIKPEARPLILKDNAARLLGLAGRGA